MDYEQLNTKQLQDECRSRGLPTGRVKAELVKRLVEDDVTGEPPVPATEDVPVTAAVPEVTSVPKELSAAPPVYRRTFPAGREGPGEQEHLDYRLRTYEAALAAGLDPRGGPLGAHRVGTVDGREVYEIRIRRGA